MRKQPSSPAEIADFVEDIVISQDLDKRTAADLVLEMSHRKSQRMFDAYRELIVRALRARREFDGRVSVAFLRAFAEIAPATPEEPVAALSSVEVAISRSPPSVAALLD